MRDDLLRWHRVASCGWIAWQCEVRGVREDTSPHYAEAGVRLDLEQEDGAEVRREEGASLMPHPPLAWPRPRSLWVEASAGPCVRPGTPSPDPSYQQPPWPQRPQHLGTSHKPAQVRPEPHIALSGGQGGHWWAAVVRFQNNWQYSYSQIDLFGCESSPNKS